MKKRTVLIMAGGTGGHIMPGLAVAAVLQQRGWEIAWMGDPQRMEGRLVPQAGITLHPIAFSGVRGKRLTTLLALPFTLLRACLQARKVFAQVKPDVALGLGGYVAFPGGLVAYLRRTPLLIHEQNAVAGTANRWLARIASKTLAGFPGALRDALVVGNPVRADMVAASPAKERYAARRGPLRLLVVGGSLGAEALNTIVPQAMSLLTPNQRPEVIHQTGEQHLERVRKRYEAVDVPADCRAFIDDMAQTMQAHDLIICRAGAMTVAEVAACGVAALFVPLPHAIDDHQTANASYLSGCDAAWLLPQAEFSAEWLAAWLQNLDRQTLADVASHAQEHASPHAAEKIADACEVLAGGAS